MSLLMDALRRAETSKQEAARALVGGEVGPGRGEKLSLEPQIPLRAEAGMEPLPAADFLPQEPDENELTLSPRVPTPPPLKPTAAAAADRPPADQTERDAIRNAFTAKLANEPPSRQALWLTLGLLSVAALAIGAYVWIQVNNLGGSALGPPNQPAFATTPTTPPPPPYAAPAVPVSPPSTFTQNSRLTAAIAPDSFATPAFSPPRPPRPSSTPTSDESAETSGSAIHLTRNKPEADTNLLRGHDNLQRNELDLARQDFQQTLRRDPNNTDALLALAAIARHQGRPGDAERRNQQALLANPSDPAAQAAVLSGAVAAADPQATESRLKSLLAGQPESAPLNFALGNLYARQQRWPEAQQVYFNAVAADSDHPDYLFNLAVSLDHIRQTRPAAQHYRLALEAAQRRPAAFDNAQVQKRLLELTAAEQPRIPN